MISGFKLSVSSGPAGTVVHDWVVDARIAGPALGARPA